MRLNPNGVFLSAILSMMCLPSVLASAAESVPNADFDKGDQSPSGWKLSGGEGRWVDRQILEVTGSGSDSNHWRCDGYQFKPGWCLH